MRARRGRPEGVVIDTQLARMARRSRGWSQQELATAASVALKTVSSAEAGKRVSLASARSMAEALDLGLACLVPAIEVPPPSTRS